MTDNYKYFNKYKRRKIKGKAARANLGIDINVNIYTRYIYIYIYIYIYTHKKIIHIDITFYLTSTFVHNTFTVFIIHYLCIILNILLSNK